MKRIKRDERESKTRRESARTDAESAGSSNAASLDPSEDAEDGRGDDADEDIEILEVAAADEAGVRLPDREPAGRLDDDDMEIDLDVDALEAAASSGASPGSPGAGAGAAAARAEAAELREQLLRTAADFDNYRKRVERDRVEERKQATAGLVRSLLPVLDSLRRALSQARVETGEEASAKGFLEGFRLIETQLFDILKSAGLEAVDASGLFDPTFHEALMQESTPDAPHMSVLEVFEPGYRLGGRLLRPARVKVANNPSAAAGETGTDTDTEQ